MLTLRRPAACAQTFVRSASRGYPIAFLLRSPRPVQPVTAADHLGRWWGAGKLPGDGVHRLVWCVQGRPGRLCDRPIDRVRVDARMAKDKEGRAVSAGNVQPGLPHDRALPPRGAGPPAGPHGWLSAGGYVGRPAAHPAGGYLPRGLPLPCRWGCLTPCRWPVGSLIFH